MRFSCLFFLGGGYVGGCSGMDGARWDRTYRASHWLLTGRGRGLLPFPSFPSYHWPVTVRGRDQDFPSVFHWPTIWKGRALALLSTFHRLANDREGGVTALPSPFHPLAGGAPWAWPTIRKQQHGAARGERRGSRRGGREGRVTFDPRWVATFDPSPPPDPGAPHIPAFDPLDLILTPAPPSSDRT